MRTDLGWYTAWMQADSPEYHSLSVTNSWVSEWDNDGF